MYEDICKLLDLVIDNSTPEKPLWNVNNRGKKNVWNYADGCMITAVGEMGKITGNIKYTDFVEDFMDYYVTDGGEIVGYNPEEHNLEAVSEGRVLFGLMQTTHQRKYQDAVTKIHSQLLTQPRTETGNFWHGQDYPAQVWLEDIYMAQVFATLYQNKFKRGDCADMLAQVKNIRQFMYDGGTKLYRHGFDCTKTAFWADRENGLSESCTARQIGWFLAGLIDLIEITEKAVRDDLVKIYKEAVDGVLKYLDPVTSMFYHVVDKKGRSGNYPETSGSCLIAYAITKGARIGIFDRSYAVKGETIFDGVCKKYLITKDGDFTLGGTCVYSGLGPDDNRKRNGTYEYYISEPVVYDDPVGLSSFFLAFTEVLRYEKAKK